MPGEICWKDSAQNSRDRVHSTGAKAAAMSGAMSTCPEDSRSERGVVQFLKDSMRILRCLTPKDVLDRWEPSPIYPKRRAYAVQCGVGG